MIYALFDVNQNRILDVFESGDRKLLMQELIDLYNRTTGEKVAAFATVEEARARTIDALARKFFPAAVAEKPTVEKTAAEVGKPAPQAAAPTEQPADRPVARARKVFEELGLDKPRKEHIAACKTLGIKESTAAAQYQAWKTMKKQAAASAAQPAAAMQ